MSSNWPYRSLTTSDLYDPKTNFQALDPSVLATQGWTATEANQVRTLLELLSAAFTNGDYIAFKDASAVLPEVSASAGAKLANLAGRLYGSFNGQAFEAMSRHANDKHASYFGIKGDGSDETSKWQAALDYFSDQGSGARPGRLLVDPTGVSIISNTLQYQGDVSRALLLECATPGNFGLSQFLLRWDPAAGTGKPVLRFLGANCSRLKNIAIDGMFTAKYLLHLDNRLPTGGGAFIPSSSNRIESCSLYKHGGAGCAAIAIGNDNPDVTGTQTSEVIVDHCYLFGRQGDNSGGHGPAGHGIKVLTVGNCKNFWVYDTAFGNHQYHVDLGASGNAVVSGGGFGLCTAACAVGGANTLLELLDYEGQPGTPYAAALFGGQGGGPNPAYKLTIRNCEAVAPLQLAGGDYTLDDVMVKSAGNIILENNTFINQRADTAEARVVAEPDALIIPPADTSGSVASSGNWYRASNQYAPIFDTNGNRLTGGNFYPSITSHSVVSINDKGGREGIDVHSLRNTMAAPMEYARHRVRDFGDGYLTTPLSSGATNQATHQLRVAYGALANNASPWWRSYVFTLNPGQRIRGARLRVDTPFAGVSGGLTLQLGIGPVAGTDEASLRGVMQLVLPSDAKTAGTYGAQLAEKGIGVHPAFMPPEGFYPGAGFVNAGTGIYVVVLVLISTAGNNLTLSAGQATVMLDTGNDDP